MENCFPGTDRSYDYTFRIALREWSEERIVLNSYPSQLQLTAVGLLVVVRKRDECFQIDDAYPGYANSKT